MFSSRQIAFQESITRVVGVFRGQTGYAAKEWIESLEAQCDVKDQEQLLPFVFRNSLSRDVLMDWFRKDIADRDWDDWEYVKDMFYQKFILPYEGCLQTLVNRSYNVRVQKSDEPVSKFNQKLRSLMLS